MSLRQDTAACLHQALHTATGLVTSGNDVAAVAVAGDSRQLFVGHGYWEAPEPFENWVALTAKWTQNYGAFVVPLLYLPGGAGGKFRSPRNEMQAGESHMLFCITWHEREGFDIHRVFYVRRPNGAPVFEAVQSFDGAVQLPATTPGAVLIQSAIQHGGSSA
jgi:hypothetical protein